MEGKVFVVFNDISFQPNENPIQATLKGNLRNESKYFLKNIIVQKINIKREETIKTFYKNDIQVLFEERTEIAPYSNPSFNLIIKTSELKYFKNFDSYKNGDEYKEIKL